jgi:hypothetical protein
MISSNESANTAPFPVAYAMGERPVFEPGDRIRVGRRSPIGHYRVPTYVRGKIGVVQGVIEPVAVDNEQEGFGRNAGDRLHYYRVAVPMKEIWESYRGASQDSLYIEVFETWLERI